MKVRIAIDAGHGPNTAGKRSPDGFKEFEFNSVTAKHLGEFLKQFDCDTLYTFSFTEDTPLKQRVGTANANNVDCFISIHANAHKEIWTEVRGIETYVYKFKIEEAYNLAKLVQKKLIEATKLKDRGVKEEDFYVLRETKMTAILVECGFFTNKEELELLKSAPYKNTCAKAIGKSVVEFYQLKKKLGMEAYDWVLKNGISDGERPHDPATREEVWNMLYRLKSKIG